MLKQLLALALFVATSVSLSAQDAAKTQSCTVANNCKDSKDMKETKDAGKTGTTAPKTAEKAN
jgi:hypothetical protein